MRELVVNDKIIDELNRAKSNGRLMHIYLFYGDDSKAMVDTAFMFACNLYCGCLNCNLCENILDDNHLNVKYITKEAEKTMLAKEQIADLITDFSKTSLIEGPRVYIIDGIDTASQAAQNTLLKFIEDPSMKDECYGILIAKNIDAVLPTIKSRCGLLYFRSKTGFELEEAISKIYNPDEAFLLSVLAKNEVMAKEIYLSQDYQNVKEMFYRFISLKSDKEAIAFFLDYQTISKELFRMFLSILIKFYNSTLLSPKLILSVIYGKIREIESSFSLTERKKRLDFLLELEDKYRVNVVTKNLLHQIIVMFF